MNRQNVMIALLVVMIVVGAMNFLAIAQVGQDFEGFPFFRLPRVFDNYRQASVKYYKNRIIKWTTLVNIPPGATDVYDDAGANVVWDAARIASINAKIAEYFDKLDGLGEGDWIYAYDPTWGG